MRSPSIRSLQAYAGRYPKELDIGSLRSPDVDRTGAAQGLGAEQERPRE